jgi:predicted nucleic acid-binding protein
VILVDTSIWVDHLRTGDARMTALLNATEVAVHPFIVGELAMGNLRQRTLVLADLGGLPQAASATDSEVMEFVARHGLYGRGIGWVDAHLLAATRLTDDCRLWTRDKNLAAVAAELGLAAG